MKQRISELPSTGSVRVTGWVDKIRNLGDVQFLILRDRTDKVQLTNTKESNNFSKNKELIDALTNESTIAVTGQIASNPNVKLGGKEIIIESIEVLSIAEPELPIDKNAKMPERLDWRFLDLRSERNLKIFEIQTYAEYLMRIFWQQEDFIEIHSPKLMRSPSESGAELFEVGYFDTKAYLAQSPQFYKQMAMAAGFDKVFEIGPVFRANPSFTSRHDTEFTSIDVEMSWIESHKTIMTFEERWLEFVLSGIKDKFGSTIKKLFGVEVVVPKLPFPAVSMSTAYELLEKMNHKVPAENNGDLDPQGEKLLSSYVAKNFGHEFVFITDYPKTVRPFYHMRHEDNPDLTKSFDLLWKGLEVTTGAQREHRRSILLKQLEEKNLSQSSVDFYLDFFRFGVPPHGGFGAGLTRILMILLGLSNVREVTYLYRGPNRLAP
jgi:nondiscriminating aspartyl-tRNA synthetase